MTSEFTMGLELAIGVLEDAIRESKKRNALPKVEPVPEDTAPMQSKSIGPHPWGSPEWAKSMNATLNRPRIVISPTVRMSDIENRHHRLCLSNKARTQAEYDVCWLLARLKDKGRVPEDGMVWGDWYRENEGMDFENHRRVIKDKAHMSHRAGVMPGYCPLCKDETNA